jgi:hypothetical protein
MNLTVEFFKSVIGHNVVLLTDYVAICITTQKNTSLKRGLTGKVVGRAPGANEWRAVVAIDGAEYYISTDCLTRVLI